MPTRLGEWCIQLIFDDVIATSTTNPINRSFDSFYTWHDYLNQKLDEMSLSDKEYQAIGENLGEAKARGIRAKNYLVKRNVPASHIVYLDGGWKNEVTTEVWIWPPNVGKPSIFSEFNFKLAEVKLEKGCKIKYRGGTE